MLRESGHWDSVADGESLKAAYRSYFNFYVENFNFFKACQIKCCFGYKFVRTTELYCLYSVRVFCFRQVLYVPSYHCINNIIILQRDSYNFLIAAKR